MLARFRPQPSPFVAGALLALALCWPLAATARNLVISVEARAADLSAGVHLLGVHELADAGFDLLDVPEPPRTPEPFLSLAFAMPGYDGPLPNRWRVDLRHTSDLGHDQSELWYASLATDLLGHVCRLEFDLRDGAGIDFELRLLGGPFGELLVPVPGAVAFVLTQTEIDFWIELHSDDPVAAAATTWSRVKSLYGRHPTATDR